jgi:sporulation protein YlmC with PRC-barrel domain
MKRHRPFITMLSIVAVLLASASFAAQSEGTAAKGVTAAGPLVHKASAFIGRGVENPQGENLGTIHDIVLDPQQGRIKYVVLSYGGVLGMGGKLFAVPWDALTPQPGGKTFLLNVEQALLETTPGFDKNNWPQRPDPMLQAAVRTPTGSMSTGTGADTERPSSGMTGGNTEQMLFAVIADLDAQQGTITLKTHAGKTVDLQAPTALLAGLQAGDVVEVSRVGDRVTTIRKKDKHNAAIQTSQ